MLLWLTRCRFVVWVSTCSSGYQKPTSSLANSSNLHNDMVTVVIQQQSNDNPVWFSSAVNCELGSYKATVDTLIMDLTEISGIPSGLWLHELGVIGLPLMARPINLHRKLNHYYPSSAANSWLTFLCQLHVLLNWSVFSARHDHQRGCKVLEGLFPRWVLRILVIFCKHDPHIPFW